MSTSVTTPCRKSGGAPLFARTPPKKRQSNPVILTMRRFPIYLLLTLNAAAIVTRHPPPADWEPGLREAVHQALVRDHPDADPATRARLLAAPFLGRHDRASPFGDIAVLARGQLYLTAAGFEFVQDSEEDCCRPHRRHDLLALWTVKRIRHRDPHRGHVFELEYTVSPVAAVDEDLVYRHGRFNYNIPGHIFVLKNHDPHPGYPQFKPGIVVGVAPDGYKHVLHSLPGFYTSYHHVGQTTVDPEEYELYKKLIESLAAKTSPHRFAFTARPTQTTYHYVVPLTEKPRPVTTVHYYTPVEEPPETVRTTRPTSTQTTMTEEEFDLFPIAPTEPMKPVTEVPESTRPGEQVPKPGTETTVPYVPSTTPKHETTMAIEKIPYTKIKTTISTSGYSTVTTTPVRTTTPKYPTTMTIEKIPYTEIQTTGIGTSGHGTSDHSTITTTPVRTTRPKHPTTMTIEKIPYTEIQTTAIGTSGYGTSDLSTITTTPIRTTTPKHPTTMTIEKIPYTEIKTTTGTSGHDRSTVVTEQIYPVTTTYRGGKTTTESVPLTTQTFVPTTRKGTKPTTIVEYSFDSTTKGYTEPFGTYTPTIRYPTTETVQYTIPTTTTQFYYTLETDLPKTQGTTLTETPMATTVLSTTQKSTTSDWLLDTDSGVNVATNVKEDVDDDDIFGKPPKPSPAPTEKTTKQVIVQSDIAQALFGNRRAKQIKVSSKLRRRPVTKGPKIIYNNFYTASLATPSHESTTNVAEVKPHTDQSYSTSISFEVNKRHGTRKSKVSVGGNYKKYERDGSVKTTTETSETKKVFDDLALQLVNHARGIDYLHNKTTRQPKYKRRNFSTKIKRNKSYKRNNDN